MNKVKFLNLLQIRKLELETKLKVKGNSSQLTEFLIKRCEGDWSSNIRDVFDKYDDALTNMCKSKNKFTNEELDDILRMLQLI